MYISSQNLFSSLRQSVLQTQSNLSTLQTEEASGTYADLGLQLGGQTGATISFAQESSHLAALTTSNEAVSTRLATTTSTINDIMSDAQALSNTLIANASSSVIPASTQTAAQTSLQSLISKLNTSTGGQYIFGGINTTTAPMPDYDTTAADVDQALNQDLPDESTATPTDLANAVSSSGHFGTLFTAGGSGALTTATTNTITSQISPQQTITTSVSANQTAFQQIAQAYALLGNLGGKTLTDATGQALVATATSLLNEGLAGLTTIQADIGTSQNSVSAANDHMSAQQTILTTNVGSAENVDTYTLSTKLSALTNQLQVAYSLTSDLKSLSLVNYLQGG